MFDMVKTGLLAGLGAAVVTRDRLEEALDKLVDQGRISRDEARRMVEELSEDGRREWERLQELLQDGVRKALETMDVASRRRQEELEKRVLNLEQRLVMAEDRLGRMS